MACAVGRHVEDVVAQDGELRFVLDGQEHTVPADDLGETVDRVALGEVAELLAPPGREVVQGEVYVLWPIAGRWADAPAAQLL